MSTTASDLPPEVWCHIGQYILPADRPNLALVNRTLYGIIASDLFTHVEVVSRNPALFVHAFQTLNREQDLAKRLRKLTIWVHALNEVVHLENTLLSLNPNPRTPEAERKPLWLKNPVRQFLGRRSTRAEVPRPRLVSASAAKHELFLNTLTKLENMNDLALVWQPDEGYNKTSPTTCSQLVSNIWIKLGNTLRSLTLDMAMFNLFEALRAPPELVALEELYIRITLERHGAFRGNASRILSTTLVPFINSLASRLTVFSFTSLCNLYLDPLFVGMEPTPLLQSLSLCLAFQVSDMWSPSALQTFLTNHNEIQQLSLRYADCCSTMFRHNWTTHDRVLIGDAFTGTNATTFPRLDAVTLGLRFKLSSNHLLGRYISRFGGSASSLTLLDRNLPFTQIKEILAPFRGTLKSLTMFVEVLTPEVLCFLAELFPALHNLTIHVQNFSSSKLPYGRKDDDAATKKMFLEEMRIGLSLDDTDTLEQWKLKEINLREFAYEKGDVPAWDVMRAIAITVPSIENWDV